MHQQTRNRVINILKYVLFYILMEIFSLENEHTYITLHGVKVNLYEIQPRLSVRIHFYTM